MFFKSLSVKSWLICISLSACLVSTIVFSYILIATSYSQNEAFANSYTREQIITAVNKERLKYNLSPLLQDSKLNKSAQAKADDMANTNPSYFSHVSPTNKKWSDFINQYDYDYDVAGENLANGYENVAKMVESWMNSPSHRENILNKDIKDTGVGIAYGKLNQRPTIFVAQHFGKSHNPSN